MFEHLALLLHVITEVVQRQWAGPGVDIGDNLSHFVITQHDHGRAENFLLQDLAVRRRIDHYPQRSAAVVDINGQWLGQTFDPRTA